MRHTDTDTVQIDRRFRRLTIRDIRIIINCSDKRLAFKIISYFGRARCLGLMLRARLLNLSIAIT